MVKIYTDGDAVITDINVAVASAPKVNEYDRILKAFIDDNTLTLEHRRHWGIIPAASFITIEGAIPFATDIALANSLTISDTGVLAFYPTGPPRGVEGRYQVLGRYFRAPSRPLISIAFGLTNGNLLSTVSVWVKDGNTYFAGLFPGTVVGWFTCIINNEGISIRLGIPGKAPTAIYVSGYDSRTTVNSTTFLSGKGATIWEDSAGFREASAVILFNRNFNNSQIVQLDTVEVPEGFLLDRVRVLADVLLPNANTSVTLEHSVDGSAYTAFSEDTYTRGTNLENKQLRFRLRILSNGSSPIIRKYEVHLLEVPDNLVILLQTAETFRNAKTATLHYAQNVGSLYGDGGSLSTFEAKVTLQPMLGRQHRLTEEFMSVTGLNFHNLEPHAIYTENVDNYGEDRNQVVLKTLTMSVDFKLASTTDL